MANISNVWEQDGHQDVQALCKRMGHSLNIGRDNFVSFSVFIFLLVDKMAHAAFKYTNHRDSNCRKSQAKFIFQQYAKVSSFFFLTSSISLYSIRKLLHTEPSIMNSLTSFIAQLLVFLHNEIDLLDVALDVYMNKVNTWEHNNHLSAVQVSRAACSAVTIN